MIRFGNRARLAAVALTVGFGLFAAPALADTSDRGEAISACRAAIATQLGVSEEAVGFDQSSTRGARYDIVFQVRGTASDGRFACRYSRSEDAVVGVAVGTRAGAGDSIALAAAN